jgi:hypothetical protein
VECTHLECLSIERIYDMNPAGYMYPFFMYSCAKGCRNPCLAGKKTEKSPLEGDFTGVEGPQNVDEAPLPGAERRHPGAYVLAIS